MLAFHGALYVVLKGSGELEERARGWAGPAGVLYLVLFVVAGVVTVVSQGHLLDNYRVYPLLWVFPLAVISFIAGALFLHRNGESGRAFLCSGLAPQRL